jgi:hypothetical protein
MLVSSVPLSETHVTGRLRTRMSRSSSRATRMPDSEVSATRHKHSRVKSSTTARIRKTPAVGQCVAHEIQGPALVRALWQCDRRSGAKGSLAAPAATHLKPLLAVEAAKLLVIHVRFLASKQNVQSPIAETPSHRGQTSADSPIIRPPQAVADRAAIGTDGSARPPLAHRIDIPQVSRGLSSGDGRHHFFEATSFSMALSSIASAKSFFSFAFLSSSAFNRRASDTSIPPNFAFHF